MEEIKLHSGNFFCNDLNFDVSYKNEIYKIHLSKRAISIVKNSIAFDSEICNIFDYDEGYNFIYNNIIYWLETEGNFSLNFLKLNFKLEEIKFRQIMAESNRSFLQILRDNNYDYEATLNHTPEDDVVNYKE